MTKPANKLVAKLMELVNKASLRISQANKTKKDYTHGLLGLCRLAPLQLYRT